MIVRSSKTCPIVNTRSRFLSEALVFHVIEIVSEQPICRGQELFSVPWTAITMQIVGERNSCCQLYHQVSVVFMETAWERDTHLSTSALKKKNIWAIFLIKLSHQQLLVPLQTTWPLLSFEEYITKVWRKKKVSPPGKCKFEWRTAFAQIL